MGRHWMAAVGLGVLLGGCTSAQFAPADGGADGDAAPDGAVSGVSPASLGDLVITEIMFDSAISDDCGEWFELYNPSAETTYELQGCIVRADTSDATTIPDSVLVAPGGLVALTNYNEANTACTSYLDSELRLDRFDGFYPGVKFGNQVADGERVELVCGDTVIDSVAYSSFGSDAYLSEFTGIAMNLDPPSFDHLDNDLGGNWCKATTTFRTVITDADLGTPGTANIPCQ